MKHNIFSVYDSKINAYMSPFFMSTKGQAIRAWIDSASDPHSMFFKHPSDFTLFQLGSYDDSNAQFDILATPLSLGVLTELLPPPITV